ncbi:hypothetical protein FLM9_273 [Candidatus Synechococcus spongiarum]|uniref:Uncharacterized protein n=1 Tax=Candidatus Synechococcus spongiarum TaxID=431041 RepID=A0A164Z3F1_9SYNE|nr:hypothetical protein FLM9_273 [Candidatus Synechococcus spongiarum]
MSTVLPRAAAVVHHGSGNPGPGVAGRLSPTGDALQFRSA